MTGLVSRIITKLKNIQLSKPPYGKVWVGKNDKWYQEIYNTRPLLHANFLEYLKKLRERDDVKSVLEIGCGTGIYPIQFKELFQGMRYVGLDISESAIEHCRSNSDFEYVCGDFLSMQLSDRYDLVFSHAVIDHVYDIELFMSKAVQMCGKYAYISSYRGFFPDLIKHEMSWNNEQGCYYNHLSAIQTERTLLKQGLQKTEFIIRPQESGQNFKTYGTETIIEITKR